MSSIKTLVLASGSPWRKSLLASTGAEFLVMTAPVDEYAITAPDPVSLAQARSEAKALATAAQLPGSLVIGADQVLSLAGRMFDKARSAAEASDRLAKMSGRSHTLHSGLALALGPTEGHGARIISAAVVDVDMPMRTLTEAEIASYVATGEWQGSVGCYQYENRGVHLFDGVTGDQSSIVGLPLQTLLKLLRTLGVDLLRQPAPPWTLR
jgi:septum formation protein